MIGSIRRKELHKALLLEPRYEIVLAVALGKPAEQVVLEQAGENGDIKYWRDDQGVHHVPKRSLEEVVVN